MLTLSWIFKLNNYISYFFIRPPPVFDLFGTNQSYFKKQEVPYGKIFRFFQGDDFPSRSH